MKVNNRTDNTLLFEALKYTCELHHYVSHFSTQKSSNNHYQFNSFLIIKNILRSFLIFQKLENIYLQTKIFSAQITKKLIF